MTTFVMLAMESVSVVEARTPSMPATETAPDPCAGQAGAAGGAGMASTWTAAIVGATAFSGHSRVVVA